jgi:hypothetical protein
VKWPELPAGSQAQILAGAGATPDAQTMQELHINDTLKGIAKVSEASDHADNLMSTKSADDPEPSPHTPMTRGVNNPSPPKAP